MKFIMYNLEKDGTIPSYVISGGFFAIPNNKKSPQDWDMIGISTGNKGLKEFKTKDELLDYVKNKYANWLVNYYWKKENG